MRCASTPLRLGAVWKLALVSVLGVVGVACDDLVPLDPCGDGTVLPGEACVLPACGDGIVQADTEACDDGIGNSNTDPNACQADCSLCQCDALSACAYAGDSYTCGPCPEGWISVQANPESYENVCLTQLLALEVIGGTLDATFDPAIHAYTVTVPDTVDQIAFRATTTDAADLEVNGEAASSGAPTRSFDLAFGSNVFDFAVAGGTSTRVVVQQGLDVTFLKASNADPEDGFGAQVVLDGNLLAVGAPGERSAGSGVAGNPDDNTVFQRGAVYVFRHTGGTWTQDAYLKPTAAGETFFGKKMSLSGDHLAVSYYSPVEGNKVDVFRRGASSWTVDQNLPGCTAAAVSGDTLAVVCTNGLRIYRRGASTWAAEATLSTTGFTLAAATGFTLDGDLLAVDAVRLSGSTAIDSVLVYRRTGTTWVPDATLESEVEQRGLVLDGDRLAMRSGPLEDGAVRVLVRTDDDGWVEEPIAATEPSDADGLAFGLPHLVLGHHVDGDRAVALWKLTAGTWTEVARVRDSDVLHPEQFGAVVSSSGDLVAIGVPDDASGARGVGGDPLDLAAPDSGAVHVLTLP